MSMEYKTFDELVSIDQEEYLFALRSKAEEWTIKEIAAGNQPYLGNFIDEYPEWNKSAFYDTIEAVMHRVSGEVR